VTPYSELLEQAGKATTVELEQSSHPANLVQESTPPPKPRDPNAPVTFTVHLHDNGPSLWPERFTEARLNQIRQTLGSYYFAALYQGSPEGGGLFQRGWFQYYREYGNNYLLANRVVPTSHCRKFGTVDLAFSTKKEADYTVICAWAVTTQCDLILLDIHRERMTGEALVPAIRSLVDKHNLEYTGIEDTQAQTLVVQTARRAGLTIRALKANLDKITRAIPAQIRMESGQVWLPRSHPDIQIFEHELLTFPKGAHDDCVDNLSYACIEVQRMGGAAIPREERERMELEAAEREWQEKLRKQQQAHQDWDDERFWLQ